MQLHDGSRVVLRKLGASYDPDRSQRRLRLHRSRSSSRTSTSPGLIHIDETGSTEFHTLNKSSAVPLNRIPYEKLSPGSAALEKLMGRYR